MPFPEFRPRSLVRSGSWNTIVNSLFNGVLGQSIPMNVTGVNDGTAPAARFRNRNTAAGHLQVEHSLTGDVIFKVTDAGTTGGAVHDRGGAVYDVKAYGAVGNGTTNDGPAIDAAVSAAQAAGGGTVYFPRGRYPYSGAGIVNEPASGVDCPLLLRGEGPSASRLTFTAVSAPQMIRLASATPIGNMVCHGSGVEGLTLSGPATADAIVLEQLEMWRVTNVVIATARTGLKLRNTRFGRAEHLYLWDWREHGISVNEGMTGTNLEDTWFEDIEISGVGNPTTGWGFSMLLGDAPVGNNGTFMKHVVVNYGSQGGMRFGTTAPSGAPNLLIFLLGCVADGAFGGPSFQVKNGSTSFFADCWAFGERVGGPIVELDRAGYLSWVGGYVSNSHTTVGGGGSCFDLKNSCINLVIKPSLTLAAAPNLGVVGVASTAGAKPQSLVYESGLQLGLASPVGADIVGSAADSPRMAGPHHVLTSDASIAGAFGLIDRGMGGMAKYLRVHPTTNELEILNAAGSAVIARLTNGGSLSVAASVVGVDSLMTNNATRRRRYSSGSLLLSSDITLSAGWGTTRTVTNVVGSDDHFSFRVNSSGTGQAVGATISVAFKDGTFTTVPVVSVSRSGGHQPAMGYEVAVSATQVVITSAAMPVAGEYYAFSVMVTGRT